MRVRTVLGVLIWRPESFPRPICPRVLDVFRFIMFRPHFCYFIYLLVLIFVQYIILWFSR